MPGVARLNDICSGHECYPPRQSIFASSNVFVNSLGWHRQSDTWQMHCDLCDEHHPCHYYWSPTYVPSPRTPIPATLPNGTVVWGHGGESVLGSSAVFINSKPAMRIGDPISCGSAVATGSMDVHCGS